MKNFKYRIYGKRKGAKRFSPFDAVNNVLCVNLIYASIFLASDYDALVKEVSNMNKDNPEYTFEIRTI
jgi:hypothetical protein